MFWGKKGFYQIAIMLALRKELPKSYIQYKFCFCEKKLDTAVAADSLGDEIVELYILKSTQLGRDLTRTEERMFVFFGISHFLWSSKGSLS